MIETTLTWKERFTFLTELDNHEFVLDVSKEGGGDDRGPRPKGLLLSALGACTGMDVVSILEKMKFKDFKFQLKVSADTEDTHPMVFKKAVLSYIFEGESLKPDSIKKAVSLSKDKYCAVSAMLQKAFEIEVKIILNGEEI
ncbi:MAG TPA: OsmC family protein [Candidatus Cloacimonadota bacterium]|nr:OsmC family protein [Candidatus Cloacimonadota bacterium]HOQ80180.1 OsmC family protein [Candidatus Cloacimonadota bacterium]HPK40886.1 OsmC family protein [Candidatus Cloacimonadota bacterium]